MEGRQKNSSILLYNIGLVEFQTNEADVGPISHLSRGLSMNSYQEFKGIEGDQCSGSAGADFFRQHLDEYRNT